jgi:hypothetical protein
MGARPGGGLMRLGWGREGGARELGSFGLEGVGDLGNGSGELEGELHWEMEGIGECI